MKQTILICCIIFITGFANGRIWTDLQGRKIDAEILIVNRNKTVVLKTARGKTAAVPFDTFSDQDIRHLEHLIDRNEREKLHPVSWQELNDLFNIEIWQDAFLWDDATAETAERMKLKAESKTDFMENHRAYPLGDEKILDEPVYASALYGGSNSVESLSFVFLNQGDMPLIGGPKTLKKIEECGERIHDALVSKLGKAKRDSLGKEDLRERVWRWDWNQHAIMLSLQEGKYVALRIMPSERADRSGRIRRVKDDEIRKRVATCVEQRSNGDVVVRNIPMIDQGPKGYCSPATWERYLRFLDIPVDMYLLALAANTKIGGGTYSTKMLEATENIISSNGRKLKKVDEEISPNAIAKYIDQGLPIMWRFLSSPHFQQVADSNTAQRKGEDFEQKDVPAGGIGGHICLIIGYNRQTGEIAISDSWGPKYAERWVPAHEAQRVSFGLMNVIKW
ncbi:MAG TPA: SHD1 domain-containing protein [Pontiella sp.]